MEKTCLLGIESPLVSLTNKGFILYFSYGLFASIHFLITDTRINDVKGVRISLDVSKNLSVSTTIPLFLNIIGVVSEKKVPRKLIIIRKMYANAIK